MQFGIIMNFWKIILDTGSCRDFLMIHERTMRMRMKNKKQKEGRTVCAVRRRQGRHVAWRKKFNKFSR